MLGARPEASEAVRGESRSEPMPTRAAFHCFSVDCSGAGPEPRACRANGRCRGGRWRLGLGWGECSRTSPVNSLRLNGI